MNDRWVDATVSTPYGPSTTAATTARGSSCSQMTCREPGSTIGERSRAAGQAQHVPGPDRVGADQPDAVPRAARLVVPVVGDPPRAAGRADQRGHEAPRRAPVPSATSRDEVEPARARLAPVDLLQPEHVGAQRARRRACRRGTSIRPSDREVPLSTFQVARRTGGR